MYKKQAQALPHQPLAHSTQKYRDAIQCIPQNRGNKMNQQIASPDSAISSQPISKPTSRTEPKNRVPLCRHRTKNGRPCRYSATDHSGLCPRHAAGPTHRHADPQIAAELLGDLTEFDSAAEVNQFLSRLLLLLAQDRVSPRRAAVMAYTCNLILHSHRAIDIENKIAANAPQEVVFDLVRPKRDDFEPEPPARASAAPAQPS
jgi:hypothetical protein